MKGLIAALAALALPTAALADQCAWIDKEQAREAVHYAAKGLKFVELCEPCGDTLDKVSVGTIESSKWQNAPDQTHQEVLINGEAKDVAYVFVETVAGSGEFENLAQLARCKTSDVSPKINVTIEKPAKTRTKAKPRGGLKPKP